MSSKPRRSLLNPTTLRVGAAGVFLIGAGSLGIVAVWNSGQQKRTPASGAAASGPPVDAPVLDVRAQGLKSGGRAQGQLFDPKEPSRLLGRFGWASFDSKGTGQARVTAPEAVVYLGPRIVAVMTAASGELTLSSANQPESGTLEGGVPIRLYARDDEDATIGFDPAGRAPLAQLFTPVVTFNIALGELSLPGEFRISSPGAELRGRGLRLLGNQVAARVELIELDSVSYAWVDPSVKSSGPRARPAPLSAAAAPDGESIESFYVASVGGGVTISRLSSVVRSESVEVLMRLVNGQFAADALGGGVDRAPRPTPLGEPDSTPAVLRGALTELSRPPPPGSEPIPGEPQSLAQVGAEPIVMRWNGPLVVTPADSRPAALRDEQIAARFIGGTTADEHSGGGVVITDSSLMGTAHATELVYGATSREITLKGRAAHAAVLSQDDRGRLEAAALTLNLATGLGHATGPGAFAGVRGGQTEREVTFSRAAEFRFGTKSGQMTDELNVVGLTGNVQGRDGKGTLAAERLEATFAQVGGLSGVLTRVSALGDASASNGPDRLKGQRLDVTFDPPPPGKRESVLRQVTAEGRVEGMRGDTSITCGLLEAEITQGPKGEPIVGDVRIDSGLVLRDRGLMVTATACRGNAITQQADLLGESVRIERDGGVVFGTQMRLDGKARSLEVFGEGGLDLVRAGTDEREVHARWTRSMRVNDLEGRMDCAGDARATAKLGPDETDELKAQRVVLNFTPGSADSSSVDRELLRAEAIGGSEETVEGLPATIESKRYAPASNGNNPAERTLERVMFIQGGRIVGENLGKAEQALAVLRIPTPGRLLVDDRRVEGKPATTNPAPGVPSDLSGGRGTTLFLWDQALSFTRATGLIDMRSGVRVLHRERPDAPVTALDCERVEAEIRVAGDSSAAVPAGSQVELRRVSAIGGAVVRNEGKRLEADRLNFDALANTLEALANPDRRVTYFDPAQAAPTSAERLYWNLRTGRVTVERPTPITVPR
ncbi:MAG: hypothetical protein ACT4PL_13500 [Phycisphaerales bacterium]